MLSKKMEEAINGQINAEMFSAYLYLSMSSWFSSRGLGGMAHWMKKQAAEEMEHAMKMYDYVIESGGRILLTDIEASRTEWESPLAAFQQQLEHERKVTGLINGLVDLARNEGDHATFNFLQWFVEEQVEEEDNATSLVNKAKMVGDDGTGLYMLDRELDGRGRNK